MPNDDPYDQVNNERRFEAERWRSHLREHDRERAELDRTTGAMNTRLADMNELRSQMGRERALYATRDTLDTMERQVTARLEQLIETVRLQLVTTQTEQNRRLSMVEPKVAASEQTLAGAPERFQRLVTTTTSVTNIEKTIAGLVEQIRHIELIERKTDGYDRGMVRIEEDSKRLGVIENKLSNYDGRTAMLSVVFLVITVLVNIALRFV